ncbi:MAG TPA: hypothetical protein P5295_20135, partial [Spirochaetota bacterium]|nr:hypothetical protein [Spirochaetota bacterium]
MKKAPFLFIYILLIIGMSCDSGGKDKTGSTGGIDTFEESSLVLPEGVNITSVDGDMTSVISGMDQ